MRLIKNLSIALLAVVVLAGCMKDDVKDIAFIYGTWKLTDSTLDGQPDLEECDLKTIFVFTADKLKTTNYYGDDCRESEITDADYTRNGNTLTIKYQGTAIATAEITKLSKTTLILTERDEEGVAVTTFARQ